MAATKRICLVTRDFIGPVRNGGIGTAFTHLARLLAAEGHKVTVLFTPGEEAEAKTMAHWVEAYAKEGITLTPLPDYGHISFRNDDVVQKAYLVYRWLKEQRFDIVHFHDWHGLGAYACLAKRQGIALQQTTLCVQLHAQALWHVQHNGGYLHRYGLLESDALERMMLEHADVIISPSEYMLEWARARGVKLPPACHVIQNVLPEAEETALPTELSPITDLVFFGRLEPRKGLDIFCAALKALPAGALDKVSITFLGKEGTIQGKPARSYLTQQLPDALQWQMKEDMDSAEAQEYLQQDGRLAVIASRMENSPYVVLECLAAGIPCIATDTGGTAELVAEADRNRVLFTPRADKLAAKLEEALRDGMKPAHPAVSVAQTRSQWLAQHGAMQATPVAEKQPAPKISVCIATHNRPELLRRAVDSIKAQTVKPHEVIVVDDGSDSPQAREYLEALEPDFAGRGWKLIRQQNAYAGAARNRAAQEATGEWLLFMDDDNVATREELATFSKAAQHSGADIYSCVVECMRENKGTVDMFGDHPQKLFVPLGGSAACGVYENMFGDVNALIRREVFTKLGGFTEDYGVGLEDMEFFAKASLAGYSIEVVPEPLFHYRENPEGVQNSTARDVNMARALRPYLAAYPAIAPALMLAQGYHLHLPKMHENYAGLEEGFSEVREANKELKTAKTTLDARTQSLEKERKKLKAVLEAMGEDTVRYVQRAQARPFTRKLLKLQVRAFNYVCDLLTKKH